MNVSILQENLLKALSRTGRVVSPKAQLPIMQNVLLAAGESRLRIVATNLETTEVVSVGAKVEKDGGICVSSRLLTDLVISLPQETVHLTAKEGALHIRAAGVNATIPGVPASEFPPVSAADGKKGVSLEKATLLDALVGVLFAAATDEGRPILTGIKVAKKGGAVVFAATDGYRLSVKHLTLSLVGDLDLVVPARALGEVFKVSQEEKDAGSVDMRQTGEGQLIFTIGDTEIHTRAIAGEYPNFEKIIPATHTTRVLVDKTSLLHAVKSAAVFARDSANILRFHIENQLLVVSANTPQVGENHVEVEAKVDGEGGDIAFNSRFLLEFLSGFTGDELLFEMTGSLNPGVFKPVKDDSYTHIIMPVRVTS
ncbi:MAG: polymerase III subunit beta, DNA polymerase III subunit beta protein [Microgenomates group bacterium GW2011_GWC1_49_7]|nr:MAG: polymerase III subunit beta, DNA polymerase III subunit beta protein [Microgenomates group bacterium GW2011_GWC1_49_7]